MTRRSTLVAARYTCGTTESGSVSAYTEAAIRAGLWHLLVREVCHGYANCCACTRCTDRARRVEILSQRMPFSQACAVAERDSETHANSKLQPPSSARRPRSNH